MKLLVVDNQTLFREGLLYLLRAIGPSVEVFQARSLREANTLLAQHPDLTAVLMEIALPDSARFGPLALWRRQRRDLPIVILSGTATPADVARARQLGANGFVSKSASSGELIGAIRRVLSGATAFPTQDKDGAQEDKGDKGDKSDKSDKGGAPRGAVATELTSRQLDVLSALARGESNKEIAQRLDLSPNTVRIHLAAIYRALGVDSRVAAVVRGQELGLVGVSGATHLEHVEDEASE